MCFGAFYLYMVGVASPQRKIADLVSKLLEWYPKNARDLPWRRTNDPYGVFVSEIMLQQTQVKTVLPYWERWMKALPTIRSLAAADPEKIHKLWEGLGYYTRVRNLQKAARLVLDQYGGQFPNDFEQVLQLPGIGRYTAGAICSIAFNQPSPIVDGNVIRVLTRVFGIAGDPKSKLVNAELWNLATRLVQNADQLGRAPADDHHADPNKRRQQFCSHLNQALMELGALLCTPRQPRCDVCPLAQRCVARKEGRTAELPALAPRPGTTRRRFVAFVVERGGKFLVRQRAAGVVNAHLWEFPNIEVANNDGDPGVACRKALGFAPSEMKRLVRINHSITRYRIQLDVFQVPVDTGIPIGRQPGRWLNPQALHQLPFVSAHKKILARLQ